MSAEYVVGADLPDLTIRWTDDPGNLIDFSTGHTFVLRVGQPGRPAAFTKTTGITGLDISNAGPDDPNVQIAWSTTGELNTLAPGSWTVQIVATRTSDSKNRPYQGIIKVKAAVG